MSHYRLGYARVSNFDQDPALQHDALTDAGCQRILVDKASGKLESRPALDDLLEQARAGDTVVVWRLDRLGRSLRHLIDVVQGLQQREVAFVSLTEQIDTSTPGGRLVFHVFGALAEFERELIRERTQAGLAAARARGRGLGHRAGLSLGPAQRTGVWVTGGQRPDLGLGRSLHLDRSPMRMHDERDAGSDVASQRVTQQPRRRVPCGASAGAVCASRDVSSLTRRCRPGLEQRAQRFGGPTPGRVLLGWGRRDRVTIPVRPTGRRRRSLRAPCTGDRCGHFPMWDRPQETVQVVLAATA